MHTGDEDETQPYEAPHASAPQPKAEVGNLHCTILKVLNFRFPGVAKHACLGVSHPGLDENTAAEIESQEEG